MDFILGLFLGLVGLVFCLIFIHDKPSGCFTIDLRDESKDVCTLDLYEDINDIYRKDHIVLEIKTFNNDSPK